MEKKAFPKEDLPILYPTEDALCRGLREKLCDALGEVEYTSWFEKSALAVKENRLTIQCINRFVQDWIITHFKNKIESILLACAPHIKEIHVEV